MAETQHKVSITLNAQDNARSIIGGLTTSLGGLATAAAGLAAGAVAGVGALGAELADLAMEAAPVGQVQETFDALAESIGEASGAMLSDLRTATNSMVSDADLMASANQFMSMGLADSAEGAAELAEMATRLGMAMGGDATESMENFALMLANQSIPRLDSFGISSGKVSERIAELMEATEGLTREQAFMQAVAEQGSAAMERLGDAGMDTAATSMAQMQATIDNLKTSIGSAFLPVLDRVLGTLADLASTYGPMLAEWASSTAGALLDGLAPALEMVAELFASPEFMAFAQDVGVALTGLLTQVAGLLINDVLPPLLQLAQTLLPALTPLISAVLDAVLPLVAELVSQFVPVLVQLLSAILPPILPLFQQLADVVVMVLDAVLPLVTTLLDMLIPVFSDLISALLPALMPLFEGLMTAFVEILTALMPLVEVLLAEFLPILTNLIVDLVPPLTTLLLAVVDVFVQLLTALVPVITALVEQLAPIIAEVADLISTALNIALDALAGLINNVVGPALEWLKSSVIDPLIGAIDGISDAVSGVIDWLSRMTDSLGNIQLPDWLTPGSPTPFENGLRGIADALNEVSGMTGEALGNLPDGASSMVEEMANRLTVMPPEDVTLKSPTSDITADLGEFAKTISTDIGAFFSTGMETIADNVTTTGDGIRGGPVTITVHIGNVTEGNAYAVGQQAGAGIRDELRRQGVIT